MSEKEIVKASRRKLVTANLAEAVDNIIERQFAYGGVPNVDYCSAKSSPHSNRSNVVSTRGKRY
jgi:hypothetical protein